MLGIRYYFDEKLYFQLHALAAASLPFQDGMNTINTIIRLFFFQFESVVSLIDYWPLSYIFTNKDFSSQNLVHFPFRMVWNTVMFKHIKLCIIWEIIALQLCSPLWDVVCYGRISLWCDVIKFNSIGYSRCWEVLLFVLFWNHQIYADDMKLIRLTSVSFSVCSDTLYAIFVIFFE